MNKTSVMWIQCCVQNVSLKVKTKNVFEKMYNYTLIITAACSSDVDVLTCRMCACLEIRTHGVVSNLSISESFSHLIYIYLF